MTYLLKYLAVLGFFLWFPVAAFASSGMVYQPLVGIPGLDGELDFNDYINALYALSISLAGLIAVIKITLAGAKYMLDPLVSGKSEAKSDIKNSLIGLIIIIGAVILLNTINSDLTNLTITAAPAAVDDSAPPGTISAADYCDDQAAKGQPCTIEYCDTLIEDYGYYINPNNVPNPGCEYICERLPGYVTDGGVFDTSNDYVGNPDGCAYSEALLTQNIAAFLTDLEAAECAGKQNCDLKLCTEMQDDYVWSEDLEEGQYQCKKECENDRQGEYLEESTACVFTTGIYLTERECSTQLDMVWNIEMNRCLEIDSDGDSLYKTACFERELILEEDDLWACDVSENQCEEIGGYEVADSDETTFVCKIPRLITNIDSSVTYTIDDPSVDGSPAGPDNGETIEFLPPYQIVDNSVLVYVGGNERWVGCGVITPAVCQ